MKKKTTCYLVFVLFLVLLIPLSAYSDTKNESSAILGFNVSEGNSDSSLINFRVNTKLERDKNLSLFQLEQNYGKTQNEKSADSSSFKYEYNRSLSERVYFGTYADIFRDEIADLRYRAYPSILIGRILVNNSKHKLRVAFGPAYIFEKLGSISSDYPAIRGQEKYEIKFNQSAKLFQSASLVNSLDNKDDYLLEAEVGIETKIIESLSLNIILNNRYNNQPSINSEKNDLSIISSIGYHF